MTVYLVTNSRNYFPVTKAVFSTREKAESFIKEQCNNNELVSEWDIEEREINDRG